MSTATAIPSVEAVMNLARVRLNDAFAGATGTPGEGRIFTDSSPFALPCLNAAILRLTTDLENANVPATRTEEFVTTIPPINSTINGGSVGQPDPTLQQIWSFAGFFDGSVQTPTPALPPDLLVPNRLWQRQSGTTNPMGDVVQVDGALQSMIQGYALGEWEWRNNSIIWNGATVPIDVRLRYTTGLGPVTAAPSAFPTTYIGLLNGLNALAYATAYEFAIAQTLPQAAADLMADYTLALNGLVQRQVRIAQSSPPTRVSYGESGDTFGGWY